MTLTLYRQLDLHAAGVPAGVLHYGPSHAGVVAGMLPRHFLYHQLVPARMEEGGGLHLRPVEEPGVGEVRARCPAAQREPRALIGNRGEGFRGHPGVLRRSWVKHYNIQLADRTLFFLGINRNGIRLDSSARGTSVHSLTTLSWMLLLRPLPPAGAVGVALQRYDPSVEATT